MASVSFAVTSSRIKFSFEEQINFKITLSEFIEIIE